MKIIVYIENYLPLSETFIENHLSFLYQNYELLILTDSILDNTLEQKYDIIVLKNKIRVSGLQKLYKNRYISLGFKNNERKKEISEIFRKFNPDFIHCHFGIQAFRLINNLSTLDIPCFITFHGYDVTQYTDSSPAYTRALKSLFRRDNIHPIFVCQFHLEYFKNRGIHSSHANVIYNGVDTTFYKRQSRIENKPLTTIYTQVGRLTEKKGHFFMIKALHKYKEMYPNKKFVYNIVGDGELSQKIKKQVSELNLFENVIMHGWKNAAEIKAILDDTHYFVHPSVTATNNDMEATSITILEAMSMELPVISTYHAGIPEILTSEENGILVEEKNIDQYCKALNQIQNWGYLKINREKVKKYYSLDIRNKSLKALYHHVLEKT